MQTNQEGLVGKILRGKYRIDERWSYLEGGFGIIYRATDISVQIDQQYIVKQFKSRFDLNTDLRNKIAERFAREAKTLQRLSSHSQIPKIVDYFEENGQLFLVQELIDGQNLHQEFAERGCLTESETLTLLQDSSEVLKFVHQNGIVHRDIKPSNLIRNKSDQKIYLIDFGIVKEVITADSLDEQGNLTKTDDIGTEGYMPIEQLQGKPKFCSDIYALGMVTIQALTGRTPQQLEYDDRGNPLWRQYIPTSDRNYNPNLLKIIDRMVRGHHKERYQSAAEVSNDLQQQVHLDSNPAQDSSPFQDDSRETVPNLPPTNSVSPWLALVLVSIIAAIAGILAFGNKQQYVAYKNSDCGLELERPENWSIQEENDFLGCGVTLIAPQENSKDDFKEEVKILVGNESAQPLSLDEYTEQAVKEIKSSSNTIIEPPQNITFANREGRKIIYQDQDGIKHQEVWRLKNQKAYTATYTAEADKFDKFAKQADKIIESLTINN